MSMRGLRSGILLAVCCALPAAAAAMQHEEDGFYRQQLLEAASAAKTGANGRADALFTTLLAQPAFQRLPIDEQAQVLGAAAWSAAQNGRIAESAALFARLAATGTDDPDDWYRMGTVYFDLGDPDASARSMTTLISRWPAVLPHLEQDFLYALAYVGDTRTPERIAFLQALFDANWDGGSRGTPDGVWLLLAQAHLRQGDADQAQRVAARITDAETLIDLRADRRNDGLLAPGDWRTNITYANAHSIDNARARMDRYPDRLEPIWTLTQVLLLGGYHEQVIAVTDDVLGRIASAPLQAPAYSDLHHQVWLMNHRAVALRRLGRIDEAVEELRRASRLGERNAPNISQALNLGSLECDRGNSAAALAAAEMAGEAGITPYGMAVQANILHCAAMQAGDAGRAEAALQTLARLRDDAVIPYLHAMLRAGRADEAAAQLPGLLEADSTRASILYWAQDCAMPPPLPAQADARSAKAAFLGRLDVMQAIDAVGRMESYDLYCHMLD